MTRGATVMTRGATVMTRGATVMAGEHSNARRPSSGGHSWSGHWYVSPAEAFSIKDCGGVKRSPNSAASSFALSMKPGRPPW